MTHRVLCNRTTQSGRPCRNLVSVVGRPCPAHRGLASAISPESAPLFEAECRIVLRQDQLWCDAHLGADVGDVGVVMAFGAPVPCQLLNTNNEDIYGALLHNRRLPSWVRDYLWDQHRDDWPAQLRHAGGAITQHMLDSLNRDLRQVHVMLDTLRRSNSGEERTNAYWALSNLSEHPRCPLSVLELMADSLRSAGSDIARWAREHPTWKKAHPEAR